MNGLSAIIWPCRFSLVKNPRANVFPVRCRPSRSRRWCRIEGQFRLARHIFSAKTSRVPVASNFKTGKANKNLEWIKKGVPVRIEIGPRDLEKNALVISRRDQPIKAKESMSIQEFVAVAPEILTSIQQNLLERAKKFRDANTRVIESKEDFYDFFTPKNPNKPEIHGGFARAHWNGSREVEEQIKNDLKVTIRVVPLGDSLEPGKCIFTGEPSVRRVVWAKSY